VNLIGEFTDYNLGLVLTFAITCRLQIQVGFLDDLDVVVSSTQARDVVVKNVRDLRLGDSVSWASYALGVVWAFREFGVDVPGLEFSIHSEIPPGVGLSSSAAIKAAIAVAINDITASNLDTLLLVRLCHEAETLTLGQDISDQENARGYSATNC
jgi:galactokinase